MARQRSMFTKSARKNLGPVLLNNFIASSQKSAKKKAVNRERQAKADERERKRGAKQREGEEKRRQARMEKERIAKAKLEKKYEQFFNRLKLEFQKRNLIDFEPVIDEIINEAFEADLSVSATVRLLVDGSESDIWWKIFWYILFEKTKFLDEGHHKQLTKNVIAKMNGKGVRDDITSETQLLNDTDVKTYLELSNFLGELKSSKILLPEDYEDVIDMSVKENLTMEKIKESETFQKSVEKKETLINDLDQRLNSLINGLVSDSK